MGVDYYNCIVCSTIICDAGDYGTCGKCEGWLCESCDIEMTNLYGSFTRDDGPENCCKMCNDCNPKMCNDCNPKIMNNKVFIKYLLYKLNKKHKKAWTECQQALTNDQDCFAKKKKKRKAENQLQPTDVITKLVEISSTT